MQLLYTIKDFLQNILLYANIYTGGIYIIIILKYIHLLHMLIKQWVSNSQPEIILDAKINTQENSDKEDENPSEKSHFISDTHLF